MVDSYDFAPFSALSDELEIELPRDIPESFRSDIRSLQAKIIRARRALEEKHGRLRVYSSLILAQSGRGNIVNLCTTALLKNVEKDGVIDRICKVRAPLQAKRIGAEFAQLALDLNQVALNETSAMYDIQIALRRSQYLNIRNVLLTNASSAFAATSLVDPADSKVTASLEAGRSRAICVGAMIQKSAGYMEALAKTNFRPSRKLGREISEFASRADAFRRDNNACPATNSLPSCVREDVGTREYHRKAATSYASVVRSQLSALESATASLSIDDWRIARNVLLANLNAGLDHSLTALTAPSGCK
ncbi:MAG: hypothetical protein PS018_03685 [bacterium]|nr:hypothetical protein [bacterium]